MKSEKESIIACCYREILLELVGDEKKTNQKIQRRLKDLGHPKANSEMLELLRKIHDQLSKEISLFDKSKYHLGYTHKFTSFEDFDSERMVRDLEQSFPAIPTEEMKQIVGLSIFGYYLR